MFIIFSKVWKCIEKFLFWEILKVDIIDLKVFLLKIFLILLGLEIFVNNSFLKIESFRKNLIFL